MLLSNGGALLRRVLLAACLCLLPLPGAAQERFEPTYPDHTSPYINDFAGLLSDPEMEEAVMDRLVVLRQETGVELVLVTLPTQDDYAPRLTLEEFATNLFNRWGIGDASRNDGILVLILSQDREARIELGAAYGDDWNYAAARAMETGFLAHFRKDAYQQGILSGIEEVIDRIALPYVEGTPPPEEYETESLPWPVAALFGLVCLFIVFGSRSSDLLTRFRTCPQCRRKGTLRASMRTLPVASTTYRKTDEVTVTCKNCDYTDIRQIRRLRTGSSTSSSGSFGGGRSGGGGASGRW